MHLSIHNRALVRGMVAGLVALAGASACSRSDRANAGRDTTQTGVVATADTQATASTQAARTDTAGVPAGQTAAAPAQTATQNPKRAEPQLRRGARDSSVNGRNQGVVGYRAMAHDTSAVPTTASATSASSSDTAMAMGEASVSDSARSAGQRSDSMAPNHAMADTVARQATGDTTGVGSSPMARDTSTTLAQADTAAAAQGHIPGQAQADTTAIQAKSDTTREAQTEVAVQSRVDTVTVVGDSALGGKPGVEPSAASARVNADSSANQSEQIRLPEDSTRLRGRVTADRGEVKADSAAAGAAGIESTGNVVSGADAIALMTRAGQRCAVVRDDTQWDLASSPATLNPCGTGTMTLPKVQMEER